MTKKVFVALMAITQLLTPGTARTPTSRGISAKTRKVPAGRALVLDDETDAAEISDLLALDSIRPARVGEVLEDADGKVVQIVEGGAPQDVATMSDGSDGEAPALGATEADERSALVAEAANLGISDIKDGDTLDSIRERMHAATAENERLAAMEEAKKLGITGLRRNATLESIREKIAEKQSEAAKDAAKQTADESGSGEGDGKNGEDLV